MSFDMIMLSVLMLSLGFNLGMWAKMEPADDKTEVVGEYVPFGFDLVHNELVTSPVACKGEHILVARSGTFCEQASNMLATTKYERKRYFETCITTGGDINEERHYILRTYSINRRCWRVVHRKIKEESWDGLGDVHQRLFGEEEDEEE